MWLKHLLVIAAVVTLAAAGPAYSQWQGSLAGNQDGCSVTRNGAFVEQQGGSTRNQVSCSGGHGGFFGNQGAYGGWLWWIVSWLHQKSG